MKICSRCNTKKEIDQFYKRKDSKDGFRADCKECCNERNRKYDELNKESIREYKKEFYKKNKSTIIERSKQWIINNPESFKEKTKRYSDKESTKINKKKYLKENYEYFSTKSREYKQNNKERLNKLQRERYINDELYRLKISLRNMLYKSLKKNGFIKESKSEEIIGCSFEYFKEYLESKFEDWMTWENYGKYNGQFNYGWDIDHIIPLSSKNNENDILELNHYTNLQPLCSKINRDIKKDKIWNYFIGI